MTDTQTPKISRRKVLTGAGGAAVGVAALASPVTQAKAATTSAPRWAMVMDLRACIGCRACTVACKAENDVSLGRFRTVILRIFMCLWRHVGNGRLELQAEINRWVDKGSDRRERDVQFRRNSIEAEADGEAFLVHTQIPELILQHYGHFIGETLVQCLRDIHARRRGLESDVEMVRAGQSAAIIDNLTQNAANNGAQGLLHDIVVRD